MHGGIELWMTLMMSNLFARNCRKHSLEAVSPYLLQARTVMAYHDAAELVSAGNGRAGLWICWIWNGEIAETLAFVFNARDS